MSAAAATEHPDRGLSYIREQSTKVSAAIFAVGILSLLLVIGGTFVVLWSNGFTPVESLIAGLGSNDLQTVLALGGLLGAAIGIVGLFTYSKMPTKVSRSQVVAGAVLGLQAAVLGALLYAFVQSDVEKFARNYLDFEVIGPLFDNYINGAKNTLLLAFTSELFGIVLGLIIAVFAISKRAVVRAPARAWINFFRGTPLIWQLIMIGVGVPIGLGISVGTYQAGIIAFSLNTSAYAAEVFRAGIRSIERSQLEAARSLGMSYMQAMRYAIIPQAVRRVVPPLMNEFVILIKDTALIIVLGLSAAQRDLMNVGSQAQANDFNATHLVMTGLGYLTITLPLIRVVNVLEKKFRSGLVGVGA